MTRHFIEIADEIDRLDPEAAARQAQHFEPTFHDAPDLTEGVWGTVFGLALAAFLVLGTVWAVERAWTKANYDMIHGERIDLD